MSVRMSEEYIFKMSYKYRLSTHNRKCMRPQAFTFQESKYFLLDLFEEHGDWDWEMDAKKQLIVARDEELEKILDFRLPLPYPSFTGDDLEAYLNELPEEIPSYAMLLVQAGAAALGYFEGGEVVLHKTIKKYMKRRSQGKAQINYLNTRGKSKAGSRIRLANTVRFFEEINEYLQKWDSYEPPERLLYSCQPRLWGLLHQAKVPPPFSKKDPRLIKVPRDIAIPDHEELLKTNEFILKGWLQVYQTGFL
jgi:hypothetical protein